MKSAIWAVILVWWAMAAGATEWYVAPAGQDAGAGTRAAPFATIGRAATVAQPGDTVRVAAGVYRETVRPARGGAAGRPVRYLADGQVTVDGCDPLRGTWQRDGQRWTLTTDQRFVQLFCDDRPMIEARWPNAPLDDPMAMPRASAGPGTDYTVLRDPRLPPGDWNGAIVLLWPGSRWSNYTRRVTNYQPGSGFDFDQTLERATKDKFHQEDPYRPRAGNPYLLYGCLAALDAPGEWLLDERGKLSFMTPDGRPPSAHELTVKQRSLAFDLHGLRFVELTGFRIRGAAFDLTDAEDCRVVGCHLRWVDQVREYTGGRVPASGCVVTGRNNEIRHCSFGQSPLTMLRIGGRDNRLLDSVLFNLNTLGSDRGGLDLGGSDGTLVSRCTLGRTGRDTIVHHGARHQRIEYCELWQTNLLNNDSGAIYCWSTDGQGGVIAYNWIHDNLGDSTVGVYLDNFSRNFVVHHNLIWNSSGSGIRLNSDAVGHLVSNNTVLRSREPFGTYCYAAYRPTMAGTRIVNNLVDQRLRLSDPAWFVQGELGPEISHNLVAAVGADGVPVAGSAALGAGLAVPGVTDGVTGKAPDVGAYQADGPRWTAGAGWHPADEPRQQPYNLTFAPLPPLTARTMLTDGLQLWLDGADEATVSRDATGRVSAWADKSPARRRLTAGPGFSYVAAGLAGQGVVRGAGQSALTVGTIRAGLGPVAAFVVAQGLTAGGPSWQRLCGAWVGDEARQDWVEPSWQLGRPGGATPAAFAPQLYTFVRPRGYTLDHVVVFGPGTGSAQYHAGDIAELLLYDRALSAAEVDAVTLYLTHKWRLAEG
ncbi:MAG: right-handed parallel beta-helix repeat-containing protein [Armatimonadetes bacterium]|nr:right-handed parallel beta-helix repeat-containing protein [Armatimonadota bacterium]